jgi:glycosyltransferase involved in cell wall biosynthesis
MCNFEKVSIIIPTFNEEQKIAECMQSLLNGEYPLGKIEFVIADGQSTDGTAEEITRFTEKNPDVRVKVVGNPDKTQGYGLNIAIGNIDQKSEIILRVDAHSVYPKNYIHDCVKTLLATDADNVGGAMVPIGKTQLQKAVSFCMSHPLGVGNARFHLGNFSGYVDTVYLGCFKKEVFDKVGLFDPAMTPNEDAEFNMRIRKSGGSIYLNSDIRVSYFPRDSVSKLMKQYFRYGRGRCRTFKKHRTLTSLRQVIPPVWIVLTLLFLVCSLFFRPFLIPLFSYFLILMSVSLYYFIIRRDAAVLLSWLCFGVMHYAWGLGFLRELLSS